MRVTLTFGHGRHGLELRVDVPLALHARYAAEYTREVLQIAQEASS